ncbi:MAG: GAF domain-containing protein [Sphingomicrobium sp.]
MSNSGLPASSDLAIQPVACHLGLSGDLRVRAASANIATVLGTPALECLGQTMTCLMPADSVHDIRNRMALLRDEQAVEHLFRRRLEPDCEPFDLSIFRVGDGFGVDFEARVDHGFGDATGLIAGMLARLKPGSDAAALGASAAGQLRSLTGFDRVSIYVRGELLCCSTRNRQALETDQPPPPVNAFMLIDRNAAPVAILTSGHHNSALACSELRSASAEELEWISTAGAEAAVVLPLAGDGETFGLASCTSAVPRHISPERRGIARLFANLFALRLQIAELRAHSN